MLLGYSVTRPGNMGSPGVVRELSGSCPGVYRDYTVTSPGSFHNSA